jgi:hypothetical protein
MREFLILASIFGSNTTYIIAGAALVVALIILVIGLFLFRNTGKKKTGNANPAAASDWQRQQGAWGQQPAGWGANAPQQPGAWGAPASPQQQGAWGASAQPQPPTPGAVAGAGWGNPPSAQQQPGAWGAPPQQQQSAGWGGPGDAQQQPGTWGTSSPSQQQQPAGWGAQQQSNWGGPADAQQQPGAWSTPASAQQQQPAGWGAQQQSGWGNQAAPQGWDQTVLPAAPASDPWGQQQAAPSWGSSSNQQQAPSAFGGSGSGQSWGQAAQPVDQWGQPIQQQGQQAGWPASAPQPSGTPPGGNAPVSSWQQQGQGFGQNQPGYGAMENPDGDRTLLRPSGAPAAGSQGRLGIVRIEEGKEPGRVYEVRKESLSIGRSRESDIFLEDLAVSRLHASIISIGSGNYALRDEGSANGTKVNGQTVNKYQPYPLQEGDKIQLGQTVLVFARR